jgi:endoplasmic reticulum chaperone BiP
VFRELSLNPTMIATRATAARASPLASRRRREHSGRAHAAGRDSKQTAVPPSRRRPAVPPPPPSTATPTLATPPPLVAAGATLLTTPPPLVAAAAAGATFGPLLDGIHSSVGLQVYDLYPLDLLGDHLRTSFLVPPLLASFYAVLSSLDAAAEALIGKEETPPPVLAPAGSSVAACYASLACGLALSASLHSLGTVSPAAIAACLALFAAANWRMFDGTKRGLALAVLCAAAAPLAEAQLMARLGAWHYPRADVSVPVLFSDAFSPAGSAPLPPAVGFVSWVPLCYFFYAPSVLLLGRKLRAARREGRRDGEAESVRRKKNETL